MTTDEELRERVAELESTVAALQEQLDAATERDIPLLKGTVRGLVDAEINEIGDLPDAGRAFQRQVTTRAERLAAVEEQLAALGDVGTAKTAKEQKLAAICAFAQNKRGTQSATVAVTASDIQGCVGVSRRYAYGLIDEAGTDYHIVGLPKSLRTVGSADIAEQGSAQYHQSALVNEDADRVRDILYEIADKKTLEIIDLTVQPDHIHLFVSSPPKRAPSLLANWFKGISSRKHNHRYADNEGEKIRWARGYDAGTAGHVSSETVQDYSQRHAVGDT